MTPEGSPPPAHLPTRVLLVEDNHSQRESLAGVLELEGFEVHSCPSGRAALQALDEGRYAVAILDLRLPDVDGGELARDLLKRRPDLRVVINTAYASLESAVSALNAGVHGFVEKASDPRELLLRVRAAVQDSMRRYAAGLEQAVAERTRELCRINASLEAEIEARRRSERRYAALVDSAPICIHEVDLDGRMTAINAAGLEILGVQRAEEVLGREITELACGEDREALRTHLEQARAGRSLRFQVRIRRGSEERILRSSLVPIRDAAGKVVRLMGHSEDVTDHLRAQARQAELTEQLRHSQKLEAVGELAAGVAHDFNNVMTVVLGYADLLRQEIGGEGELGEAIAGIETACHQAVDLTRSLLSFGGKEVSRKEPVDLWEVAMEAVQLMRHMMPAAVRVEPPPQPSPRVFARLHRAQLSQVLLNLAVNARDAMPEGGSLALRVLTEQREGQATAVLEVSDSGRGMPEEVRTRIFEPFFTTKSRGKGTGLGLAVAHGIVTEHGGSIEVRSHPGRGSTFRLAFPACDAGGSVEAALPHASAAAAAGKRVLVIEDDPLVRELVQHFLQEAQFEVVLSGDGQEGLEAFGARGPFELVVLDEDMPRMSGSECLAQIRQRAPETPVVFTSGLLNLAEHAPSGPTIVLQKPFRLQQFHQAVNEALGLAVGR